MTVVYPKITYYLYYRDESDVLVKEDITADIVSAQTCSYGIEGISNLDRVAATGQLVFVLRNDAGCKGGVQGYYSPYHKEAKYGWRTGLTVELVISYTGEDYVKFRGTISNIQPDSGENNLRRVRVTVVDWMEYAANQPVYLPPLQENKKIEDVVAALINSMPIKPKEVIYYEGADTFSSVFDTLKEKTRVLSEFNKVAISELGYIYLKKDKEYGETLVVEGRHKRTFESSITQYPLPSKLSGFLLLETGDCLLQENADKLLLNQTFDLVISDFMRNLDVSYGQNVTNFVNVKSYPRRTDTSPVVLYQFSSAIELAPGETKVIVGRYRDPNQSAQKVAGKSMIAPLLGTDYKMWQNSDGSGTDLSSYLSITAYYGADGVSYTLKNNAAVTGYITNPLLQARGLGIYMYEPTENIAEDEESQSLYGYKELTLDQKYQDLPYASQAIAQTIVSQDKAPREVAERIYFNANLNEMLMTLFLHADIGDLIYVTEKQTGIDGYYYIHGVQFEIGPGGVINFSWTLKEKLSLNVVYWLLGEVGYSELGVTTILGY